LTHARDARLVPVIPCISAREGKDNNEYEGNDCVHPTPARKMGADNDSEESSGASLGRVITDQQRKLKGIKKRRSLADLEP